MELERLYPIKDFNYFFEDYLDIDFDLNCWLMYSKTN